MTDKELMQQLHNCPDDGLRQLTKQYAGLVFSVVRAVLGGYPNADVEECVADTFSEFYFDLSCVDLEKGSLRGYLCIIARHNALDIARKRKRAVCEPLDEEKEDEEFSVEDRLIDDEMKKSLTRAVDALGAPDKEIIVRKFYLGQSSKAVAQILGLTETNVNVRTHRALKKLKKDLVGGESDEKTE